MSHQSALQRRDQILAYDEMNPQQRRDAFEQNAREIARLTRIVEERADERVSLQVLIDQVPDYLFVKDAESRFVIANKSVAADYGRSNPADLFGLTDFDLHPKDVAQQFFDIEQNVIESGRAMVDLEEIMLDAAGAKKFLSTTKVPFCNVRGQIVGIVGIGRDVTARRQADLLRHGQAQILEMIATGAQLEDVLAHLVRLVESQLPGINGSILLLDDDGAHFSSGVAPSLPGAFVKAIQGAPIGPTAGSCGTAAYRRQSVASADIANDALWRDSGVLAAEYGLRSCLSTPIMSHSGAVLGTFAMYSKEVRDPTAAETRLVEFATRIAGIAIERKLAEDRIHFMATHDVLTGLPNRALLKDRLAQALLYAKRYDRWVTVLFVDLDNFKFVNDSLGHSAGDELLKAAARRMVESVRATDTVVRLGGDEFVILLLDQSKDSAAISSTMQKIRAAIAEPIRFEGHDFQVTCSIGVANYPNDGADADALLANADAAMYRAKEIGRDTYQFYKPELNTKIHEKFLLQKELRSAIANNELVLHYQPQVDLRTGRVFAVEALIRWRHPTHGMISPMKFIPMAEETGLIVPVGEWVLHEACRQNKAWQDSGLPPMTICVNVSARQFKERNWVGFVASTLHDTGLKAEYLELEITESLIMQDVEQAVATMKELQVLGVQLAIDDFGTGYSSLAALKRFPVARLKIDKSFIGDIPRDDNDRAVASAVISLGQKLNLRVIAEGVETDAQVAFLRENDCDEMQGYHFSKPISAPEIERLLANIAVDRASQKAKLVNES
jgi:diguanylate cyclase (GGDEF)-like protein/PAS domain S-box-containing protein